MKIKVVAPWWQNQECGFLDKLGPSSKSVILRPRSDVEQCETEKEFVSVEVSRTHWDKEEEEWSGAKH